MIQTVRLFFTGSLRRQLIASIHAIFLLFTGAMIAIVIHLQTQLLHERLIVRCQQYGKVISTTMLQWVLTGDLAALAEEMNAVREIPEVQNVAILDLDEKVLGHTNPLFVGKYIIDINSHDLLKRCGRTGRPVIVSDKTSEVESVTPQIENGRIIGFVRVSLNGRSTVELIRRYALRMILLGFSLLLLGAGITVFIGQRLIGPIPALSDIVSGFRVGDAVPPMPDWRKDEIGVLSRRIRRFMTELNAKDKEVRDYQNGLEAMVSQRTAALEEKTRELAKINKLFVGRENRMVELKKENAELRKRLETNSGSNGRA
jgi:HAMP domain-containing protein